MGLKLERGLKHQTEAINSINSVFENVEINNNTYKYANPIINLSSPELKNNIKKLNSKLPYSMRKNVEIGEFLNLDIKMETGTGKTYAYTKMIYELNKNYGFYHPDAEMDLKIISPIIGEISVRIRSPC